METWDAIRARRNVRSDLGQATMSMMIAAADLGIGSGALGPLVTAQRPQHQGS